MTSRSIGPIASSRPFLTVRQVAEELGYCERQVRRWIAAGLLPVHRLGRSVRISKPDLAAFLAAARHSGR
ncbi:MAG: helix-turn-helix domain-containing protein [Geminicoccaceae bacterium]